MKIFGIFLYFLSLWAPVASFAGTTSTEQNIKGSVNFMASQEKNPSSMVHKEAKNVDEIFVNKQKLLKTIKNMSRRDVAVLFNLMEKKKELDRREKKLQERFFLLEVVQKKMDKQHREMQDLKKVLDETIMRYTDINDSELLRMRKIYTQMDPEAVAKVWNALSIEVILNLVSGMKERSVSQILALMDTKKVQDITLLLYNNSVKNKNRIYLKSDE